LIVEVRPPAAALLAIWKTILPLPVITTSKIKDIALTFVSPLFITIEPRAAVVLDRPDVDCEKEEEAL
jgi:hypothetical protein